MKKLKTDRRGLLAASLCNQHLYAKAPRLQVVSSLLGLQAQFANYPKHALRIRARDYLPQSWNEGLVKTWTFRGTLHLVDKNELGLYISMLGVSKQWDDGWGIPRRRKPRLAAMLQEWIQGGVCEREELKSLCRKRRINAALLDQIFHGWGGLIKEMCHRGLIAYAPGTEKRFVSCGKIERMDCDQARRIVMERYFTRLGPATLEDFAAFAGFKKSTVRDLAAKFPLQLKSVECDSVDYYYLGTCETAQEIPPCLFLAGFDQLLMAYKDRSRLLDEKNRSDVITNTGIIHPTVMLDGRLRAKWKLTGQALSIHPFGKIGADKRKEIACAAKSIFGDEVREICFV